MTGTPSTKKIGPQSGGNVAAIFRAEEVCRVLRHHRDRLRKVETLCGLRESRVQQAPRHIVGGEHVEQTEVRQPHRADIAGMRSAENDAR